MRPDVSKEVAALRTALLNWLESQDADMDVAMLAMSLIIGANIARIASSAQDADLGAVCFADGVRNTAREAFKMMRE